jgi:hypothetical protein
MTSGAVAGALARVAAVVRRCSGVSGDGPERKPEGADAVPARRESGAERGGSARFQADFHDLVEIDSARFRTGAGDVNYARPTATHKFAIAR